MCIDQRQFNKMEERLDNFIEEYHDDKIENRIVLKELYTLINALRDEQNKAKGMVGAVVFIMSGVGVVIGMFFDHFLD